MLKNSERRIASITCPFFCPKSLDHLTAIMCGRRQARFFTKRKVGKTLILLNYSHPITAEQMSQIETIARQKITQIISIPVQFDNVNPFQSQLQNLMTKMPLTTEQLQSMTILLNLPAFNIITALLLAELHGRMGYFPLILRIRPVPGSHPPRYDIAEIINLQSIRDGAREKR